jgi:hypothetical protein
MVIILIAVMLIVIMLFVSKQQVVEFARERRRRFQQGVINATGEVVASISSWALPAKVSRCSLPRLRSSASSGVSRTRELPTAESIIVLLSSKAAPSSKAHDVRGSALGQSRPNFSSELDRFERLTDDAALGDTRKGCSVGEARDEKCRQRRGAHMNAARDVGAAHSRHRKVDQHQIDVLFALQKIKGRSTAANFVNDGPDDAVGDAVDGAIHAFRRHVIEQKNRRLMSREIVLEG